MGNLDALRDWGHAKDYVRMQWMMLQQELPEDFVIATGVQYSVRQFIQWSAAELGITLEFEGHGIDERGIVTSITGGKATSLKVGDVIIKIDRSYFRPTEVETLLGDPSKAKEKLGWVPEITVQEMCREMVASDLEEAKKHAPHTFLFCSRSVEPNPSHIPSQILKNYGDDINNFDDKKLLEEYKQYVSNNIVVMIKGIIHAVLINYS
jgi:hypothetical protein